MIDLNTRTTSEYPWTDKDRHRTIGGKIMAGTILLDHVRPGMTAYDEDNWIVITTGPLTGTELELDDAALVAIAKETLEKKTGARGLRGVMERVLQPLMYESPSDYRIEKITITEDYVLGKSEPVLVRNEAREQPAPLLVAPAEAAPQRRNRRGNVS